MLRIKINDKKFYQMWRCNAEKNKKSWSFQACVDEITSFDKTKNRKLDENSWNK